MDKNIVEQFVLETQPADENNPVCELCDGQHGRNYLCQISFNTGSV